MSPQAFNLTLPATTASPVAPALLDNLAARVRQAGVCLVSMHADGTAAYCDPMANPFFLRFVYPLVNCDRAFSEKIRSTLIDVPAAVLEPVPGIVLAVSRCIDRRQITGAIALAARCEPFPLGEDVIRACSRFEIDPGWLQSQARSLPCYTHEQLAHQASLLSAMVRDQMKLSSLEHERNTLSEQLANTYEELTLIYQISSGMRVNRRGTDFFRQACQDVLEVMNVASIGVAIHRDAGMNFEPALYGSLSLPDLTLHRLTEQLIPTLRLCKSQLLINDLSSDPNFRWLSAHARQLLAVPLQRQEQVLGCMFLLDKTSGEFDSADAKLFHSIANESAIYLENSQLFGDVHGLMMGLLHSLTSAVDAKDSYTCGHSERVALLSRHLASQIGLPDAEIEQVYMAGLLHDVGKIGVPESVLQKTGRLTNEEFEQMKKHPQIGARILADVKQIKALIPGVLHHHERYDGKGYPTGIAGAEIPLMGRIICLADCFDAMTSNRTYRKALPLEVALTEIRRCAGTQFDPTLAEAFLHTGADTLRELLRNHGEKSRKLLDLHQSLHAA